jgi:hypothetical protein
VRRRVQISFLSAFLTLLTVAFAAALMVRVRSYSVKTSTDATAATTESAAAQAANGKGSSRTSFVPLSDDGTPGSAPGTPKTSTSAAVSRAQRFRELLALGAPKPATTNPGTPIPAQVRPTPPPAPVKPQGLIAKLLQPIANAFGSKPAGSAQPNQPPGTQPKTPPSNDPKDPNSDTVPPQGLYCGDWTLEQLQLQDNA